MCDDSQSYKKTKKNCLESCFFLLPMVCPGLSNYAGVAMLVGACLFGYMLAFLQHRLSTIVTSLDVDRPLMPTKPKSTSSWKSKKEYLDLPPSFPSGEFGFYFNSTKEASEKLLEALQDDSCYVIGLYGNRGSGKTSLMRAEVNEYRKVFDRVLFPTVSKNQDIYNIQERIANKMDNVHFQSDDNEITRVVKILSGLVEMEGTTLVILDDFPRMSKPLEVGIPLRNRRYKVLLITHNKSDCILMGCDRWISLNALHKHEAWQLLKYLSSVSTKIDLSDVAQEVALKCNGLPDLIKDVVSSLSQKSIMGWKESLVSLSHSTARYQIFISFRGPDTRNEFAMPLYKALCSTGFKTFIDDKSMEGGTLIEKLLDDIEESRFAIIIFSKNYAESKWCLRELVKILECKDHEKKKQLVLPIFYDVPPKDVSDVLNSYADAMTKHENNGEDSDTLKTWKKALHDVCKLKGFEKTQEWNKDEFIGNIVKFACDQRHRLHVQSMYTGPSQTSGASKKSIMGWKETLVSLSHSTARYQIFISFRGPDTRYEFAMPLYKALCSAGFKTFIDDKSMKGGTLIEKLLDDIEESRFAIIIFSKNYAESKWCLRELVKILECKDHEKKKQLVLPIFYDVPPKDVSDVLNSYADAMTKHDNNGQDSDTLKTWKKTLHDVCKLKGFEKTQEWSKDEFIGNIVKFAHDQRHRLHIQSMYTGPSQTSGAEAIFCSLSSFSEPNSCNDGFMYFKSTIQALDDLQKALLDDSYHSIGLYGRGGVGKTALVNSEIPQYEKIFDQVLFVTVPISGNEDLRNLGGQIASQLNLSFGENISNLERSIQVKAILENKKNILVIFDDVSTMFDPRDIGIPNPSKQCKLLWISRDKNKLSIRSCRPLIPLLPLSSEDAWKFLQQYSGIHDDGSSPEGLVNVARQVAARCKGLPRVIQDVVFSLPNINTDVVFSLPNNNTEDYWTEALDSLNHVTATHQIFISFKGSDSRHIFSEPLCHALARQGFKVFMDTELGSGDQVPETLIGTIEQSRASIVVLSQNYAQSRWCLDELLKIMECRVENKQLVLPIFYEVDRNDVRCVKGPYKEAMDQNEERYGEDKVHEWSSALQEVAGLPGKHYQGGSHDTFVQEIVNYFEDNRHRLYII